MSLSQAHYNVALSRNCVISKLGRAAQCLEEEDHFSWPVVLFDIYLFITFFLLFPSFQTKLFLASVEEEGQAGEERMEMAETLLSALTDRQQQRQTWRDR